jgi:hypothetical protein
VAPVKGAADPKVVLLAASGGGTRAALYTASVLDGLSQIGAGEDIVLLSGVSGGSAAIAYYTMHRDALGKVGDGGRSQADWDAYADVMATSFIEEVLRGSTETRVAGRTPLGKLLAESFQRHMGDDEKTLVLRLGQAKTGLILNTTLAASADGVPGTGQWKPASPKVAGGRLLFTNLSLHTPSAFPREGFQGVEKEYLNHVLIPDPEVLLTNAAALSANFPPVFPDAAVEVAAAKKYWVTDGGASENRGALSLLYALRGALVDEQNGRKRVPPEIHIVIADASALTLDYSRDRGVGATLGSAEKYTSELMVGLLNDVRRAYEKLKGPEGGLQVHFLPMPSVFRARGGVGTHWMLPAFATLVELQDDGSRGESVTLRGNTIKNLIMALHRADKSHSLPGQAADDSELRKVWAWIERDQHQQSWNNLLKIYRADGK